MVVACPTLAPPATRALPDLLLAHALPDPCPTSLACVQANCEQLFSTAGNLSDPNMDEHFLAILTSIIKNKAAFNPKVAAILDKYYAKFHDHSDDKLAPPPSTPARTPSGAGPSSA